MGLTPGNFRLGGVPRHPHGRKHLKQFIALTKPDIKFDPHGLGFVQLEADKLDEIGEDIGISKRRSKWRGIRTTNEGQAVLNVTLNGVEIKPTMMVSLQTMENSMILASHRKTV